MVLGSTQPLVKMSNRNIPGGKGGRYVRLTTSPPLRAECHEIWKPKPPVTLWPTPGLLRDPFAFMKIVSIKAIRIFLRVVNEFLSAPSTFILRLWWDSVCYAHVIMLFIHEFGENLRWEGRTFLTDVLETLCYFWSKKCLRVVSVPCRVVHHLQSYLFLFVLLCHRDPGTPEGTAVERPWFWSHPTWARSL